MVFVVTGVEEGTALMIPKMRLGGQTRPTHDTTISPHGGRQGSNQDLQLVSAAGPGGCGPCP